MNVNNLGKEIAKQRKEKHLSLREVADIAGLSRQAVLNAENGDARFENAVRIAKALGLAERKLVQLAQADAARLCCA